MISYLCRYLKVISLHGGVLFLSTSFQVHFFLFSLRKTQSLDCIYMTFLFCIEDGRSKNQPAMLEIQETVVSATKLKLPGFL